MRKIRRFDKKTFKPQYVLRKLNVGIYNFQSHVPLSREDEKILRHWRNPGWSRSCAYRAFGEWKRGEREHNDYYTKERLTLEKLRSTAYSKVCKGKKGRTIIDAGCGMSPDMCIALDQDNFKAAYKIDLYYYSPRPRHGLTELLGDIRERQKKIPTGCADVVVSQAVLDLMDAQGRDKFYKEAKRWLKKGGVLSVYIVNIQLGYGFDINDEREAIEELGFEIVEKFANGFVARKK